MTELLQQVFAQIIQLSPEQQDAIAARFLAELQDEPKLEVSVAVALQELQKLCAEENYTLMVPSREDRSNASVEINALPI